MAERLDLIETLYTNRSIRRFEPDPVPDDVIRKLIEAATQAPNGRNAQQWRFVAIKDPEIRARVGAIYREAWAEYSPPSRLASITDPRARRRLESAVHLSETMGTEPPLLVLVCAERPTVEGVPADRRTFDLRTLAGTVYPAVQNLLLAARAYGLGGCITTVHLLRETKLKSLLRIPREVDTYALVPIGRPRDRFGSLRRQPVEEVTFVDCWDRRFT